MSEVQTSTVPGWVASVRDNLPFGTAIAGLAGGAAAYALHAKFVADLTWGIATAIVLASSVVASAQALRRGNLGVDVIAALAMAGALLLHEFPTANLIAVMLAGGGALERFATARARRNLEALLARAPRVAHRRVGQAVFDVPLVEVRASDTLLIKPGEVVPTDGILLSDAAVLDESALTGESRPASYEKSSPLRSGGANAGAPFEIRATASAEASTYAGILRLVRSSEEARAPFTRLADRYALWFLGVTIVVAGASWAISGLPEQALAVLVVATPCPLILAAPAALIAGVSRAARRGIVVKGPAVLEALAKVTVVLLDKTGTITAGRPTIIAVESVESTTTDNLVLMAASVEQISTHPFAPAVMAEARLRGLTPLFPEQGTEQPGVGAEGLVGGKRVAVGKLSWVTRGSPRSLWARSIERRVLAEGSSTAFVAIEGVLVGALIFADPIRSEAPRAIQALRDLGIRRVSMVTGDHPDIAELVGDAVGVDSVFAERSPAEKVETVSLAKREGATVMVGDGMNDAPALALADVGVAMGARGAVAAAEAADIVLTGDRLEGLAEAVRIARRTRRIAVESVVAGMGMSLIAMIFAALGMLPPITGAILQEAIDVAVVLNALRALGGGKASRRPSPSSEALGVKLQSVHGHLEAGINELGVLAGRLNTLRNPELQNELQRVCAFLDDELLPHERSEQAEAYPVLAKLLAGKDPTGPLIRTHGEIARLCRLFARLVDQIPKDNPSADDLRDVRRTLYGLQAILGLHFAQENELYSLLSAA